MSPPPVADLHAAAAVIALALVALAAFEMLRLGQGPTVEVPWERFTALAQGRGLADEARESLASWARRGGLEEPSSVLEDRATFDRFVRDRVADLDGLPGAPPGSPERREALARLSRLRSQLGHEPAPPPAPIVSSRDLVPGVRVTVRPDVPAGGTAPPARLLVSHVDEEAIELSPVDDDPAERAFHDAASVGRGVWAVFGRAGETTFRFRSRVLARPGVEASSLVLAHGDFLVKEERRRTPRIDHRVTATVRSVDADESRAFTAETLDLSGGGLALVAPGPVARGSRLAMELPLESADAAIQVTVKVVGAGVREGEGPRRTFLNTQFLDLAPAARGRLQTFLGAARKAAGATPKAVSRAR